MAEAEGDGLALPSDLGVIAPVATFAARKVLFTETALKEIGFLIVEVVRLWLFPSASLFEFSDLAASLSDPPLTLTSAELGSRRSSPRDSCGLSDSLFPSPFT